MIVPHPLVGWFGAEFLARSIGLSTSLSVSGARPAGLSTSPCVGGSGDQQDG